MVIIWRFDSPEQRTQLGPINDLRHRQRESPELSNQAKEDRSELIGIAYYYVSRRVA